MCISKIQYTKHETIVISKVKKINKQTYTLENGACVYKVNMCERGGSIWDSTKTWEEVDHAKIAKVRQSQREQKIQMAKKLLEDNKLFNKMILNGLIQELDAYDEKDSNK